MRHRDTAAPAGAAAAAEAVTVPPHHQAEAAGGHAYGEEDFEAPGSWLVREDVAHDAAPTSAAAAPLQLGAAAATSTPSTAADRGEPFRGVPRFSEPDLLAWRRESETKHRLSMRHTRWLAAVRDARRAVLPAHLADPAPHHWTVRLTAAAGAALHPTHCQAPDEEGRRVQLDRTASIVIRDRPGVGAAPWRDDDLYYVQRRWLNLCNRHDSEGVTEQQAEVLRGVATATDARRWAALIDVHDHELARLALDFEAVMEVEERAWRLGRDRDLTAPRVQRMVYFMLSRELLWDACPSPPSTGRQVSSRALDLAPRPARRV